LVRVLVEPSAAIVEPELRRHARLLSALLIATLGLGIVSISLTLADPAVTDERARAGLVAMTLVALGLLGAVYAISRTRHSRVAAALTVGIILLATFAAIATGPSRILLLAFPVIAGVLSGVFLPPLASGGVFMATLLMTLTLPLFMPGVALSDVVTSGFLIVVVGAITVAGATQHQQDIDQIRAQAHDLAHQANHDSLTHLPNRAAAISTLMGASARADRGGQQLCLAFLDLTDFKLINDTYGHPIGDEVLCEVARRLSASVRAGDFVARLGGDEFVVIAENLPDVSDARALFDRVLDAIAEPMSCAGETLATAANVGIAFSAGLEKSPLDLLRKADLALYRAKWDGDSRTSIYDDEFERELLGKADVENSLAATLVHGGDQLRLRYQPIVDAQTSDIVGVEALISWDRPGYGIMVPDAFIPIAEQSDLIVALDRWVMREAARQLVEWSGRPEVSGIRVSVNISGRTVLSPCLVEYVREALASSGLEPGRLVLEMTETVIVADVNRAATQLEGIRGLGVGIAIDDFGTGFTSIAHLRGLPISEIKIDRSLIAGVADEGSRGVVELVRRLAEHVEAATVAEGVETDAQRIVLRDLGCTALQGFLFSPPLGPEALVRWARERAVSVVR